MILRPLIGHPHVPPAFWRTDAWIHACVVAINMLYNFFFG